MNRSFRIAPPRVLRLAIITVSVALLWPIPAHAGLLDIFSSIESTINGTIGQALQSIRSVETEVQSMYEEVLWPVALVRQAQSFVTQTIQTYRGWMNSILNLSIASAQLSTPRQFESWILSKSATSVSQMSEGFIATYGALPTAQQARSTSLQIIDISDALAKDALAQSMASDQVNTQMLSLANQMESGITATAPGSSPYFTASALTATLETQAFQLKLMASQLREESAQLAHENARLKQRISERNQLNQNLQQMLTVRP